ISIDGFGDFSSLMWGIGRGNRFEVHGGVRFPHSLGLFYTAFTQLLGFPKYGDEYKMMGLSAYGEPRFVEQVRDVVHAEEAQIRLNPDYFVHHSEGVEMSWNDCEPAVGRVYSDKLPEVFGPARVPRSELEPRHADLAASVQAVLEERYFEILNYVQRKTGLKTVCLAGAVPLNSVPNANIFHMPPFRDVYVQAASHDAGTSIGAALYVQHQELNQPRSFTMRHVYYGPQYSQAEIRQELEQTGVRFHPLAEDELVDQTARQIADG